MNPLFTSPSFWAGALGFLASMLGLFGIAFVAEDQATLANAIPLIITTLTSIVSVVRRIVSPPARLP